MKLSSDSQPSLVFFGTEKWGSPILELLHQTYHVKAVVTKPDAPAGRHHQLTPTPIKQTALKLGLPVLQPQRLGDIRADLKALNAQLGVLVAYGRLVPTDIIDIFDYGIINGHPSLLPKYRGPAPIENIILDSAQPGFSVIQLSSQMDAGDILSSKALISIDVSSITSQQLYELSGLEGSKIIKTVIANVFAHTTKPIAQNESQATYTKLIQKSDGLINWSNSADHIERQVRAYLGWPGSRTTVDNIEVTITKSHVVKAPGPSHQPGTPYQTESGELAIACQQSSLVIDSLKPAGKNEMTGRAFLTGHRLLN